MVEDFGFELPDTRYSFYSSGELVKVNIVRHWNKPDGYEDDEISFRCSFDIIRASEVTHLPTGCNESKAVDIAHQLYEQTEEDKEDTNSYWDTEAIYAAERRMGA